MGKMRKRSRELSGPMFDWIREKVEKKWTAKQIDDHLQRLRPSSRADTPGGLERFLEEHESDRLPSYEQIRRIVSDLTAQDMSGTWDVRGKDTMPEDLHCILDVLAWVSLDTHGRKTTITNAEAAWILRVAKAAPTAGNRIIWRLVQRYMLAEAKGGSTEALDTYLAFKPWESANRFYNYDYALKREWITEAPGRFEMEAEYPDWKERVLQGLFKNPSERGDVLDFEPLAFRQEVCGYEREGAEVVERIRVRWPWLYQRVLEVWDECRERSDQFVEQMDVKYHRRDEYQLTIQEMAKAESNWEKYRRIIDYFRDDAPLNITDEEFERLVNPPGESQEKGEPVKKTGRKTGNTGDK